MPMFSRLPKRNPYGHHDWLSRDYADIVCRAVGCQFNLAGKCAVPSIAIIADDGRCLGFKCKTVGPVTGD